jgi:malate permease and related proteins
MLIIIEQIGILAILGLIGFLAFRLKWLNKDINTSLVKLIMRITLPLLLFTSFAHADFTFDIFKNGIVVFIMAISSVVLLFIVSSISAKFLKLDKENKSLHRANSMFGNVVFLGFPLLNAVFPGGEGLLFAGIFQLGHDILMWTWGIFILNKGSEKSSKENWKHLINPITIGFAIGLGFMFTNIEIPNVIFNPLYGLGHSTIYISMVYVGAILAQVKLIRVLLNYRAWIVSLNKLVLVPLLFVLIINLVQASGIINISKEAAGVIVLQAGMPCMILISVLARDLGLNDRQAVENIFLSTILSLFTLPLLFYLI